MKTAFCLVLAVLTLNATDGLAAQQTPDSRVIASGKDWSITAEQFQEILSSLPGEPHDYYADPKNQRKFLDQLVQMWVLAAEAREKNTDIGTKLKARIDFYINNLTSHEYKRRIADSVQVDDDAVDAYYQTHVDDFRQVRLSHILIFNGDSQMVRRNGLKDALPAAEARKKAEELRTKLMNGADFSDLAKEYSQDERSAPSGGDVGFISRGELAAVLETAAFALKPGEISDIVESVFGFHILRVTETRVKPLEDVRDEIRQELSSEEVDSLIQARVNDADVKIDESYFQR